MQPKNEAACLHVNGFYFFFLSVHLRRTHLCENSPASLWKTGFAGHRRQKAREAEYNKNTMYVSEKTTLEQMKNCPVFFCFFRVKKERKMFVLVSQNKSSAALSNGCVSQTGRTAIQSSFTTETTLKPSGSALFRHMSSRKNGTACCRQKSKTKISPEQVPVYFYTNENGEIILCE